MAVCPLRAAGHADNLENTGRSCRVPILIGHVRLAVRGAHGSADLGAGWRGSEPATIAARLRIALITVPLFESTRFDVKGAGCLSSRARIHRRAVAGVQIPRSIDPAELVTID